MRTFVTVCAACLVVTPLGARDPAPSLADVLARVSAYVARYQQDFSTVVASERYVQTLTASAIPFGSAPPIMRREIVAEYALVPTRDGRTWVGFRDVVAVDGKPVGDTRERLEQLMRDPSADGFAEARRLAFASATHNLGPLVRTINVPTMALEFLAAPAQYRSRFAKRSERRADDAVTWELTFHERSRPTLIRTGTGRDLFARGVIVADPTSGRVLSTELATEHMDGGGVNRTRIRVRYAFDEHAQMWVPVEMREEYDTPRQRITATATYNNFRRFQTGARIVP